MTENKDGKTGNMMRLDDNYMEAFIPHPTGQQSYSESLMMQGATIMTRNVQDALYMYDGMARRVCDAPAKEMTRAGFTIMDSEDEKKVHPDNDEVQSQCEALNLGQVFNTAMQWRNCYGGSLVVMGLNDGGTLDDEANDEKIKAIEFLRVYDKWDCQPVAWYEDLANPKFGQVKIWQINSSNRASAINYTVHETRCIMFDGEGIPNNMRAQNNGWGASVLQAVLRALLRFNNGYKYAMLLLERLQQAVHGIPDLADTLDEPDGAAKVKKRVAVVDHTRSVLNTVIIDALETYEVKSQTLSGIHELLDRFAEAVSTSTGIPMYVLTGRSIGGLNSTGESNQQAWHAKIESDQNDFLRKPVDRIVTIFMRINSDGATDGGDYKIKFNPLSVPSDKDQSEIDSKKATAEKAEMETMRGYVELGALDPEEVRQQIAERYDVDPDLMPEPPPEPASNVVLNPGQEIVEDVPGAANSNKPPQPVGKKAPAPRRKAAK